MFEDFRKQAEEADFPEEGQDGSLHPRYVRPEDGRILGMTPAQRFIVALFMLVMTIVLGALFLVVTSKVYPPFLG